jgi:hypothetical protein
MPEYSLPLYANNKYKMKERSAIDGKRQEKQQTERQRQKPQQK